MTKLKSKKMTKSTFAIIIMALVIVALLTFGGTFAYFTATDTATAGTVKTKVLKLDGVTGSGSISLATGADIVPNQSVDLASATELAKVTITGNTIVAIRVGLDSSVTPGSNNTGYNATTEATNKYISIDVIDGAGKAAGETGATWAVGTDGYYYYLSPVTATSSGVALNTILGSVSVSLNKLADNTYQDLTISCGLTFDVVQLEYNENLPQDGVSACDTVAEFQGLAGWPSHGA